MSHIPVARADRTRANTICCVVVLHSDQCFSAPMIGVSWSKGGKERGTYSYALIHVYCHVEEGIGGREKGLGRLSWGGGYRREGEG